MSDWWQGWVFGVFSAFPIAVVGVAILRVAGDASEAEREGGGTRRAITEGRVRKGGLNDAPTSPRPSPPPGQGGRRQWTDENKHGRAA